MVKTLKNPIEVRGYEMFDKYKLRGVLRYDIESKKMVVSCSYGYEKSGKFIPSEIKEHNFSVTFVGDDFDRLNARIRQMDQGHVYDILEGRLYELLQEKHNLFRE